MDFLVLTALIDCLSHTPLILRDFINDIPELDRKARRRKGKWSVHENACHLAQAEAMIHSRFKTFRDVAHPEFTPYLPGQTVPDDDLIELDLAEQLDSFEALRKETVVLLRSYHPGIWEREAVHPEYHTYTPKILLRHTLMHDHFHMYRMEELWLTRGGSIN